MNAYYNDRRVNDSNNDILRDLLTGTAASAPAWKKHADGVLAFLAAMLAALTGTVARRIFRAVTFTLILFGMIAVIGAVEAGTIGLGMGTLIGLPLLALEFLCLRKQ